MPVITEAPWNEWFVRCDELFAGRRGMPWSSTGERNYTRRFRVIVKTKHMSEVSVCMCPHIPLPYSPYIIPNIEYDLLALLVQMEAEQEHDDDWQNWIVTLSYSTRMPEGGQTIDANGNPLFPGYVGDANSTQNHPELEPPEIEWDAEESKEAATRDRRGAPLVNSAGMPFSPALEFDKMHSILLMTRNETNFTAAIANRYAFSLNDDTFLGYAPRGTVLCYPPKARKLYRGSQAYWRVSYKLKFGALVERFNEQTEEWEETLEDWQPEVIDQGMYRWDKGNTPNDPTTWKSVAIKDSHAKPLTSSKLLDGNGQVLAPNDEGLFDPVTIRFQMRHYTSFTDLLEFGMQ